MEEDISSHKLKSHLIDYKSHEIRTYMTRIIGMTDLTLMTELTEEQLDYLTVIKSSTKSLLKVLNDILDYSKILAGKANLEQVPFAIRETINEVIDIVTIAAKQKNIHLRLNSLDKSIPKKLIGDATRLKQVLSNLIDNSINFTDNGEVTIQVDIEDQDEISMQLKFIVTDTGTGVPEEKLVRLLESFGQDGSINRLESEGAGLAISQKLVELMKGKLYVESTEGIGSKFYFTAVFGIQGKGGC
ncbi:histidine kinase [Desulfosporosinus acidiphilus SJ4]|uniref:Circadian input-output histidine kinase CikA n=1 Tax=Desulfosporosinus acidiphilus (strain DSM 22704 / JCM 16185 / SJ4) TaxID=646529 RepID=I4D1P3_DESAJ|nr:ATP-binding protein [Desulfosporosinus acidiphilus]AFM39717.1 histidine kinase [Desulfosporosinus acidiphilus SJ4]